MPKLIKLYIVNCALGFVISAIFVGMLLCFDIMGLWGLVSRSADGLMAVVLLWVLNGIVFASVQFAIAVMRIGVGEENVPGS